MLASNFYTTCLWMSLQVSIRLGSPPAYPNLTTLVKVVAQVEDAPSEAVADHASLSSQTQVVSNQVAVQGLWVSTGCPYAS